MNLFDFSPYQQPIMMQGVPQQAPAPVAAPQKQVVAASPYQPTPPNMQEYYSNVSSSLPAMAMNFGGGGASREDRQAINSERMRLEDLMRQGGNENDAQIEQMRESLNQYKASPRGLDWSPALSLIDSMNQGSNLAATYNQSSLRPESQNQRMEKIMRGENDLAEARNRATRSDVDASKAMLTSLENRADQNASARERGQTLGYMRFREGLATNAQKDVNGFLTKIDKTSEEDSSRFNQMEDSFSRGDLQSVMSNLGNYARSVSGEKGVLTDTDIARIIPKNWNSSIASFFARFNEVPTEQLPPEFTKNLQELLVLARNKQAKALENRVKSYQSRTNAMPMYAPVTEYTNPIFEQSVQNINSAFRVNGNPESQNVGMTPQQRLEYLRAKQGK
jgi:hypothetical protein